jgi:hypothetical protein
MSETTVVKGTGLWGCRSTGPNAKQSAAAALDRKVQTTTNAMPGRFFVHRFLPTRDGEAVRAEAVIAYRDAWECSCGDLTVDGRLRQLGEMVQLQLPEEQPAELIVERWYFASHTIRRGGEAVQVWERVEGPSAE